MAIVVMAASTVGCRDTESPVADTTSDTPVVYVINYPLQYFTERLVGDDAEVRFPAPAGEDPAFWTPDAEAIAAYQSADLIVLNGANYARWIDVASLPASKLVDTSSSFSDELIHIEESNTHSHGPTGDHSHVGTASNTWLDFEQAIAQAKAIHGALVRLRPDMVETFSANLAALEHDLRGLDGRMMTLAQTIGERPLVASQPVYQYWAQRYGLNLRAVTWEGVPDARALSDLEQILAEHPAKLVIWEAAPDPRVVELLEQRGLRTTVFDPCANVPAEGDFLSVMNDNIANLERALR